MVVRSASGRSRATADASAFDFSATLGMLLSHGVWTDLTFSAVMAATAEHVFPLLLLIGLATRCFDLGLASPQPSNATGSADRPCGQRQ